jgi:hypothetical protein
MNKSKIYSSILTAITAFVLWDLVNYFVVDLAFPRASLERYTFGVPMVMVIFIVLLSRNTRSRGQRKTVNNEIANRHCRAGGVCATRLSQGSRPSLP